MTQYKKGINTRNKIYAAAKENIYLYGYREATVERIAAAADVPMSLVNYYFKKNELLTLVFRELSSQAKEAAARQTAEAPCEPLTEHILFIRIFFNAVLGDDRLKRLFTEAFLGKVLGPEEMLHAYNDLPVIMRKYNIEISATMLYQLFLAEYGACLELLRDRIARLSAAQGEPLIDFSNDSRKACRSGYNARTACLK